MSHVIKLAVLSAVTVMGLSTIVPEPASASPMVVQSRMQQMMDRSARRQARLAEDRRFAEEEARMAAEAQAEAARRAQAEAARQAEVQAAAQPADAAEEPSDAAEEPAQTPTPQI
ncbi:hypothetical protein [Brevundimonas subvibrioides]|uniref:Uncharacterized protein n=1 Tax=Brevundimonas subvibrioides (strain ATCC 15264 / DSM 4735 / LMG 14903 / NBRC 16000 / CB 81) TaxID=633149 RepID=D9QFI4_BRESC|nr:hypothetical protein [Brevundimonas subvibrioides]ADL02499.1 hypothetical protein Bresu_3193 [Brevundimonas subvibrioides ATCC 15264]